MENNNSIEINNLVKEFKKNTIFNELNISIPKNKITTIFGKSGSGKTTLLNIIGSLETFKKGDIKIFGKKIPKVNSSNSTKYRRYEIGYLFQNFGLIENKTVKFNLNIAMQYSNFHFKQRKKEMIDALKKVNMENSLKERIYNLSGGEQQRVAMARLFLKPSNIILADEPTGSLDKDNRNQIANYLLQLKNMGKTIIIVSHDHYFENISDKIINL